MRAKPLFFPFTYSPMPLHKIPLRRSHFLVAFAVTVIVLVIVQCQHPEWSLRPEAVQPEARAQAEPDDSIIRQARHVDSLLLRRRSVPVLVKADGTPVKNRLTSVVSFDVSFPDLNDVQLTTAQRLGVPLMASRAEAAQGKDKLVYVGDSPHYALMSLKHSAPYLVPRAATLLNTIARAFNDSCVTKGYPFYKLLVTSVLRTQEDVQHLRRVNQNASENSCHQYGTTFDISYNKFLLVTDPDKGRSEIVYVTPPKGILSEVLEDLRLAGACYVKFEKKQSCFHITAR